MNQLAATFHAVASSVEGYVQQVAVSNLSNAYFLFVQGWVPERKGPEVLDAKLLEKYGIAISKWSRARQKQAGMANMQYIRFGCLFVLMATHGKLHIQAEFDPKSGLLRFGGKTPVWAKPNLSLLTALKKLAG